MWETHDVETDDGIIASYRVVPDEEILASRYARIEQEHRMGIRKEVRAKKERDDVARELAKMIDEMEEEGEIVTDLFIRSLKIIAGFALVCGGMFGVF